MAIYYPDILEHNNSSYPLLDATSLKGTAYPLASISTTGSIPADKRNVGMIVFDSGSGKFYGYKGSNVSNWATASNWIEFGSGSGAGETIQTGSFLYSGSYNSAASAITLYSKDTNYTLDLSGLAGGGGGGFPITASNEGSDLTNSMTKIDFVGNAVTATNFGSIVTVTINTGSALVIDTGSFYYSSSVSDNVITFNQGDGTTESITITSLPSASYAPNIYNSNGTLTGQRTVTIPNNTTLRFTPSTDAVFQINNQGGNVVLNGLPTGISSSLLAINPTTGYVAVMSTSSIQNVISSSFASTASYAANIYTSDGTLPNGNRTITFLDNSVLRFDLSSSIAGSPRILFNTNSGTSGVRITGSGYIALDVPGVGMQHIPNTVQPNILGRDAQGNITYFSTSSIGSTAFVQGGNTFGTTATLGTNDAQSLVFETNNSARASISSTGTVTVGDGGVGSLHTILNGSGTTTTAGTATLLTLATTTGYGYTVHAYVTGMSTANSIGGEVIGVFKNISGTLSSAGSPVATVIEDFSGSPTFTLTTSGTNIILQVTGQAATDIEWAGSLRYITTSGPVGGE